MPQNRLMVAPATLSGNPGRQRRPAGEVAHALVRRIHAPGDDVLHGDQRSTPTRSQAPVIAIPSSSSVTNARQRAAVARERRAHST